MSPRLKLIAAVWLTVALLLGITSFAGGDTAIISGWLFLLWTVPFGAIWWFYLYDFALAWMPANVAQPLGTAVAVVLAFLFWFVLIPRVMKARKIAQAAVRQ
jgi:drug/metabolite transporter (DMT)-like permease